MRENGILQRVFDEIKAYAATAQSLQALQQFMVETIATRLDYYHWTGFYMLDPEDDQTLVLGPYVGAATEHVRIPVQEGICGAAVAQQATIIVDDVHADPRYLACSLETQSEIVVPIRVQARAVGEADRIVGEIDIDSHDRAAFTQEDRAFLEACAELVGRFIERTQ